MKADITPFLSELYTAKYQIYSLNELGRKSQHKELDDFGVVEVFYDKEAFHEAVSLQVSKRVKTGRGARGRGRAKCSTG